MRKRFVSENSGLRRLTTSLLAPVTGHSTDHLVFLASDTISSTLGVPLGTGCVVFSLACCMLGLALLLKVGRAENVSERLLDGALGGVELARGFAVDDDGFVSTYLGSIAAQGRTLGRRT